MKLLTILLLLFSFKVQAIPHAAIDALTVNETLHQLMLRLEFEYNIHYEIERKSSETDPRSNYDRLKMLEDNIKPTFPSLQNELTTYKAELHIEEDARLEEVARVKNIRDRLKALNHRAPSMRKHLSVPNPKAWLRDNINTMDKVEMEGHLQAIELEDISLKVFYDGLTVKENQWKASRDYLKAYDCKSFPLASYARNLCRFQQGR